MIRRLFDRTVSALCYSLATEHARDFDVLRPPYNDVVRFVRAQYGRMSEPLRLPILAATLGFAVAALPSGSLFHRLSPSCRARIVGRWRAAPVGPCRDLIRFYESLVILSIHARRAEAPGATT
ncbi:MAG: hypothetical protein CMJ18_16225 [Phycisphaeraceae bacterium]|nr:hypothetical protein [Phycisphaeraceae bacterium]